MFIRIFTVLMFMLGYSALFGWSVAQHPVHISVVKCVNEIAIMGPFPQLQLVLDPSEDQEVVTTYDRSNTYRICSSSDGMKITGFLDQPMPFHTDLSVYLAPPGRGITTGFKSLSPISQDLVIGVPSTFDSGLAIIYRFSASKFAKETQEMRVLTLTLVQETP